MEQMTIFVFFFFKIKFNHTDTTQIKKITDTKKQIVSRLYKLITLMKFQI